MTQDTPSSLPTKQPDNTREYHPLDCIVFWRTTGPFGELSNMASDFPVRVGGVLIPSIEALYQSLRFPHAPDTQRAILGSPSPRASKKRAYSQITNSRPDWDNIKVRIMRWCIRIKLGHAPERFGKVLLSTGQRPIVERSSKDIFWGATIRDNGKLIGKNVLGRLLMELRNELRQQGPSAYTTISPPQVNNLLLLGTPITTTHCDPIGDRIRPSP